ncbi:signal peptidase I (plasmid) [Streptomyces sp. BI20]|uniref:signal peptidase I n=1 Tax=Streptomyces sp. BI20 TaxID=3403460 RepID=UPI003C754191
MGRRARTRKGSGGGHGRRRRRPLWQESLVVIGVALAISVLVKSFLLQVFVIPSNSMWDTLRVGDRVVVDKLTPWFGSQPERGEVVVFHDPLNWLAAEPAPQPDLVHKALAPIGLLPSAGEKDLIKRTIAIAGDTVSCAAGGPVVVNGRALDEPYLFPGSSPCDDAPFAPVTVPAGKIWVMGDHRQNSRDSRYHVNDATHGFVPVDKVIGRAVAVVWPIPHWAPLPTH